MSASRTSRAARRSPSRRRRSKRANTGLWGPHQLHVVSRADAPLALATDEIPIDLTDQVVTEGKLMPDEITTLLPGESRAITVVLPVRAERKR